jgi:hypothetical protein
MATLEINTLRAAITAAGAQWVARDPAPSELRGLGWEPTPPSLLQPALANAVRLKTTRLAALFGGAAALPTIALDAGVAGGPAAGPSLPKVVDWRTKGVIGPVTDQARCGSCVSFATTGMVGAMAAIESGGKPIELSQSDQHFNSSHGPSCSGWNNGAALGQMQSRGVVGVEDEPYMQGFDSPPILDPTFPPSQDIWQARARIIADRPRKAYTVMDISAWSGDDRKTYLAHVGPMVCGFTVYSDFYSYNGGVYSHVSGGVEGGHAVMVIGYDDTLQCWICRNSWGNGFGGPAHPDGTGAGFFKIKYGQCGIDGEAFFGAQGIIEPASLNWGGWWPIQGGIAAPNTSVFGTSRSTDKLDIFSVGTDHGTYTAAWQPGDPHWEGWWRVQSGLSAPNTSITGVSRSADKLDIFGIGTDQKVYTAAWQPGDKTWGGWWVVANGLVTAPSTSVFGVSRSTDKLDIFAVGSDHGIYTAAWQPGDAHWGGWWRIQNGSAAPNTSVTGVSRSADKLDIFCVGPDQHIYTAAWQPGDAHWGGWWPIQGGVAAPGTSVFGVSRSTDKLDVFCIGTDMQVYTAAWEPGFTSWHGWWAIGHFKAMAGTSVYAVSRATDRIDIFAVGEDGGIYTASWQPSQTQWSAWSRILDGAVAPGTMVSAVVRSANHLDVFAVGTDHHVYTAAWQP